MVFCNYTIYLPEQPFYPLLVFGILYSLHRLAPIIKKERFLFIALIDIPEASTKKNAKTKARNGIAMLF
jgi:hypothetical protein